MLRRSLAFLLPLVALAVPAFAVVTEIGTDIGILSSGSGLDADLYEPASAVNFGDGHYLLVWSGDGTDSGYEIGAGLIDGATNGAIGVAVISSGTGNARHPRAAFDPVREKYLVVWSQDAGVPGAFEIYGALVDADLSDVGAPIRISNAGADDNDLAFDAVRPDVAADREGNFVVVWNADDDVLGFGDGVFDVYARQITSTGQMPAPAQRITDASASGAVPSNDALDARIVFNPPQEDYGVYYEADLDGGTYYDPNIYLAILDNTGSLKRAAPPVQISARGLGKDDAFSAKNPEVAYDSRQKQMLVVWDVEDGTQASIQGRMLLSDYSVSGPVLFLSDPLAGSDTVCIARDPTVTYQQNADRFLVGWSGSVAPAASCPQEREILVREVDNSGTVLGGVPQVISTSGVAGSLAESATSPDIVPNPVDLTLLAVWSADLDATGDFDLEGQFLSLDAATAVPEDRPNLPTELALDAAPNPFNPATVIRFALPAEGSVELAVYDVRGARVRTLSDAVMPAGYHEVRWNGRDERGRGVASGVYYLRLALQGEVRTHRVALLK